MTPVKDNDAMVLCIGEDGFFSFYAHGAKKLVSNHASALQTFAESTFILRKSSANSLTLKEANHLKTYVGVDASLLCMSCASIVGEIATRLIQEDDAKTLYPWVMGALKAMSEGKDPLTASLLFFARTLSVMGFGLNVDECVLCGRKDRIISSSFQEGGFLCEDCALEIGAEHLPTMHLKVLRYIYKAPLSDFGRVSLDPLVAKSVFLELCKQTEDMTGLHLRSIDFLMKI